MSKLEIEVLARDPHFLESEAKLNAEIRTIKVDEKSKQKLDHWYMEHE